MLFFLLFSSRRNSQHTKQQEYLSRCTIWYSLYADFLIIGILWSTIAFNKGILSFVGCPLWVRRKRFFLPTNASILNSFLCGIVKSPPEGFVSNIACIWMVLTKMKSQKINSVVQNPRKEKKKRIVFLFTYVYMNESCKMTNCCSATAPSDTQTGRNVPTSSWQTNFSALFVWAFSRFILVSFYVSWMPSCLLPNEYGMMNDSFVHYISANILSSCQLVFMHAQRWLIIKRMINLKSNTANF